MTERAPDRRIDRLDRTLGTVWSRLTGTLFAAFGLALLLSALATGDAAGHWPLLLGAALMLGLAWLAFRSRRGLGEVLDEGPARRGR